MPRNKTIRNEIRTVEVVESAKTFNFCLAALRYRRRSTIC